MVHHSAYATFTASKEVHDKLKHAQDLLRHSVPNGDLVHRALYLLIEDLHRKKFDEVKPPRATIRLSGRKIAAPQNRPNS